MRVTARQSHHRALTLLELLLAIGLIIALLASMFAFLFDIMDTRSRTAELTARQRAATTLIDRLESDLIACITADSQAGAGVRGDESSVTVLTRNVPVHLAQRGGDDPATLADLQQASYTYDLATRQISIRRRVVGDGAAGRDAEAFPLDAQLGKIRFRYHDGNQWRDSFDSAAANQLPAAVEVAVWFQPWPIDLLDDRSFGATEEGTSSPDTGLERLTFDPDANFDEDAYAAISDFDSQDEPVPDRLRIIIVPDALAPEDEDNEAFFANTESEGEEVQ